MKYLSILFAIIACNSGGIQQPDATAASSEKAMPMVSLDSIIPAEYDANGKLITLEKTPEEWQKQLSEMQYYVLRKEGTERSFTGALWDNHDKGTFVCAGCGLPLFSSETKFKSGTGWPSFWKPISEDCIADKSDNTLGMDRTEVECARCGGHQGHVFADGPPPTGLRYCINSAALKLVKE